MTPNDTASTALCSWILITRKSPLRLTGTNENLVINYKYPAIALQTSYSTPVVLTMQVYASVQVL